MISLAIAQFQVFQLKSEDKRDLYSCWKKCVFVCVFVTQVASAAQS